MKFKRLKPTMIKSWIANDINKLLFQLSEKAKGKSKEDLKRITNQPEIVLIAAFDEGDAIVGIAAIHFYETLIKRTGIIEDVVVDEKCRGKGIGRKLVELLIEEAKERKANCVELTSNSKRKEANSLYESFGFRKRETNCYRLDLFI